MADYITNRLLTYCATHSWKIELPLILILFKIPQLVPITHSAVRRAITNNIGILIWESSSINAYTARISYHLPLLFYIQNHQSIRSVKNKTYHNHKAKTLIDASNTDVLTHHPIQAQLNGLPKKWQDQCESHGVHCFYWYTSSIHSY